MTIYNIRRFVRLINKNKKVPFTVGENIIATIKMRNNFCYPLKMVIFPTLR